MSGFGRGGARVGAGRTSSAARDSLSRKDYQCPVCGTQKRILF